MRAGRATHGARAALVVGTTATEVKIPVARPVSRGPGMMLVEGGPTLAAQPMVEGKPTLPNHKTVAAPPTAAGRGMLSRMGPLQPMQG